MKFNSAADPLLLFILSGFFIISSGSEFIFTFGLVLTNIIVLKKWIKIILEPKNIEINNFFSLCILTAYISSSLVTQVNIYRINFVYTAVYFNISQYYLSFTVAIILLACSLLEFFGNKKPFIITISQSGVLSEKRVIGQFVKIFFIIIVISFYTGKIRFGANTQLSEYTSEVSVLGNLISMLLVPVGSLSLLFARLNKSSSKFDSYLYYFIALFLLILMQSLGRRYFAFAAIIYIIVIGMSVDRIKITIKGIVLVIFLIIFIDFGTTLYQAMRAVNSYNQEIPYIERLVEGFNILMDPKIIELDDTINQNLAERPFVILYPAQLLGQFNLSNIKYGYNLINNFLWAIPRVFIGNKYYLTDEDLISQILSLPESDEAFTIIIAGLLDFGILGAIIFPILLMELYKYLYNKFNIYLYPSFRLIIFSSLLHLLLNVENPTYTYFIFIRNLVIVFLLLKLFFIINRKV